MAFPIQQQIVGQFFFKQNKGDAYVNLFAMNYRCKMWYLVENVVWKCKNEALQLTANQKII